MGKRGVSQFLILIVCATVIWWSISSIVYELEIMESRKSFVASIEENNALLDDEGQSPSPPEETPITTEEPSTIEVATETEVVVEDTSSIDAILDDKFYADIADAVESFALNESFTEQEALMNVDPEVTFAEPLVSTESDLSGQLSQSGVYIYTNDARTDNGLSELSMNTKLNNAAQAKVTDMFARQYFEHVSPLGRDVSDLADDVNYAFLAVGENLALGDFEDNQTLVQGWMNSPGHRENILGKSFTEIGVAVGKGDFEGVETWLAVQIFGRPLSDCPAVDSVLADNIEVSKKIIASFGLALIEARREVEEYQPKTTVAYGALVDDFNNLVQQYNTMAETIKSMVNTYNSQVRAFNSCIEG